MRWALRDWFNAVAVDEDGNALPVKEIQARCKMARTDITRIRGGGDVTPEKVAQIAKGLGVPVPAFQVALASAPLDPPRALIRRAIAALEEAEGALGASDATERPETLREAVGGALEALDGDLDDGTATPGKARRRRSG